MKNSNIGTITFPEEYYGKKERKMLENVIVNCADICREISISVKDFAEMCNCNASTINRNRANAIREFDFAQLHSFGLELLYNIDILVSEKNDSNISNKVEELILNGVSDYIADDPFTNNIFANNDSCKIYNWYIIDWEKHIGFVSQLQHFTLKKQYYRNIDKINKEVANEYIDYLYKANLYFTTPALLKYISQIEYLLHICNKLFKTNDEIVYISPVSIKTMNDFDLCKFRYYNCQKVETLESFYNSDFEQDLSSLLIKADGYKLLFVSDKMEYEKIISLVIDDTKLGNVIFAYIEDNNLHLLLCTQLINIYSLK